MTTSRINLSLPPVAKSSEAVADVRPHEAPRSVEAPDKVGEPFAEGGRALIEQATELVSQQVLVPPQSDPRDNDGKNSTAFDKVALRNALAVLLAELRLAPDGGEGPTSSQALEFLRLIDALRPPAPGLAWEGLLPEMLIWPENFALFDQELGLFSPTGDAQLNFRALSLANPPLRIPVVVITRGDAAQEGLLERFGLPRGQAFQVVGTYRDGDGEAYLLLSRGEAFGVFEPPTSIPLSLISELLSHLIVGDARIERALRDVEAEYAKLPVDRSCCMHVVASAGLSQAPRAARAELPRGGEKCWTCPHAHALCQPHRS